jgi:oligopeptide/dipeptide ABC transporter ATP-binding protein
MANEAPLLELRDVKKHFPVGRGLLRRAPEGLIRAVDGISFRVPEGETLSIVGESGCGKTTTARLILHIELPTSGTVLFQGRPLDGFDAAELKNFRSSVQAVFQDPWSSLNPRMRVGSIIAEPLVVNGHLARSALRSRVAELLVQVGLRPDHAQLYPHQFSGGQRQRIAIARALSVQPRLIVLDEPVSALDVSIRAQILNLLRDLQDRLGVSYVMIAHHLATVRHMSHQVAVMYLGQIVEMAPARELFANPLHPYTQALYAAALSTSLAKASAPPIIGEVPSPLDPPSGCRFHTRCPHAIPECAVIEPQMRELTPGHWVQDCRCVHVGLQTGNTNVGANTTERSPLYGSGAGPVHE